MQLSMGLMQTQQLRLTQRIELALEGIEWSLVTALKTTGGALPPFVPPTFEEEKFTPRLQLARQRIPDFDALAHEERMHRIDVANEAFRFAYVDVPPRERGGPTHYYRIPFTRNYNTDPATIAQRISCEAYVRATAILAAAGEAERIVRAIPYHGLRTAVLHHLERDHGVGLADVVLVAVDRGGRLPCLVLMRALGLPTMQSLKVDQGGGQLDEDRFHEFIEAGALRGKHVLFVDSTVDSGRQIRVIERYFEDATWRSRLGCRSWSVVGSNEVGRDLAHHRNINWGVDPDRTFEDRPELMGIDYAPGTHTKVVERPSESSEAIRRCLLAVPDGWILTGDVDQQIASQRSEWARRQRERRRVHRIAVRDARVQHREEVAAFRRAQALERQHMRIEDAIVRITATPRWAELAQQALPIEAIPASFPNGAEHPFHNVLVVGHGQRDLPDASVQFIADQLGPHCSLFAGTADGNPGAVLRAVLANPRVATPEVRLYQPERARERVGERVGGVPVVFVGPEKDDMRRRMIADSHAVLALGGATGTLREVLLALEVGTPTVLIDGYGPVPECVWSDRVFRKKPNLIWCQNLVEAITTILALPTAA
jgi:hypoxanthine phosphoribosyltransferase